MEAFYRVSCILMLTFIRYTDRTQYTVTDRQIDRHNTTEIM